MEFKNTKNFYEILEIPVDATQPEVKTAYHTMARKYHPDINKSPDAIGMFKLIKQAYETLSDTKKRKQYNIINGIFEPVKAQEIPPQTNKTESKSSKTFEQKSNVKSTSKKDKMSIWRKIKLIILRIKKGKDKNKPQKGCNITTEVVITQEEVITGGKRIINVLATQACKKCGGHKFMNGSKCLYCNGTGETSIRKKITVTIPKGVKDGAKLRIKGEGGAGKNGASNGDLFIIVKIETKQQVQVDKLNIYYNVPITPFEAVLGDEIKIQTYDGTIKLKLPQNTTSGQKFRISGQGIKKNGKVGDLIVTVNIEVPQNLTEDEIRLYERLKNLSNEDVRKNFSSGL